MSVKGTDKTEVTLSIEQEDYTCSDGCCYDWWYTLYIDDVEIGRYSEIEPEPIIYSLNYLGIDVLYLGVLYKSDGERGGLK